jgi:hypothetical protein
MRMGMGYVVHLHHAEWGAQYTWRGARCCVYGGYLGVHWSVRGRRTGGVESAHPGVGVRLLGSGWESRSEGAGVGAGGGGRACLGREWATVMAVVAATVWGGDKAC